MDYVFVADKHLFIYIRDSLPHAKVFDKYVASIHVYNKLTKQHIHNEHNEQHMSMYTQ